MAPVAQNSRWYAKYRKIHTEPAIEHANLRFLAWRDGTCTLFALALLTPLLAVLSILDWTEVLYVSMGCIVGALLMGTAARNAACSLVRHVVAFEAAGAIPSNT
jgi:hypothetical protein